MSAIGYGSGLGLSGSSAALLGQRGVLGSGGFGKDSTQVTLSAATALIPEVNSVSDNNTSLTLYSYDGTSKRIPSITQRVGAVYATDPDPASAQTSRAICDSANRLDSLGGVAQHQLLRLVRPIATAAVGMLCLSAQAQFPSGMGRAEAARVDCAMNWAEQAYPTVLTPPATSQVSEPYYYRYYAGSRSYTGTSGADGHAYYLDTALLDLGLRADWLAATGCQFEPRIWQTGFEQESDFASFYITPQGHLGSTYQALVTDTVHGGTKAHAAWVTKANPKPAPGDNTNHRGYLTIQLHKLTGGGWRTPVLVEWWVWQDMTLESPASPPVGVGISACEWISYATLSLDKSAAWSRVVLLNQGWEGFTHLMHLKAQGDRSWTFQSTSVAVQQRQWTRISLWLDARASGGRARAWVDGKLASEGPVLGGHGVLEQAHFGLYADSDCRAGKVINDDLRILESGSFTPPPEGDAYLPPERPGSAPAVQ